MGFDINIKAYRLFLQIEVGIRELLIECIQEMGVHEWSTKFLGTNQQNTIGDIHKRVTEARKNDNIPKIEDEYFLKLSRAKREKTLKTMNLWHPFYYLNWPDMEALMTMKNNTKIIDDKIGELNRDALITQLKLLNHLRNDIAHARFISEANFTFISASHEQIRVLIPNFSELYSTQSTEQNTESIFENLRMIVSKICDESILDLNEINELQSLLNKCENSFWLNYQDLELVKVIKDLNSKLNEYKNIREKPGGLLSLQKLKPKLKDIGNLIKSKIHG